MDSVGGGYSAPAAPAGQTTQRQPNTQQQQQYMQQQMHYHMRQMQEQMLQQPSSHSQQQQQQPQQQGGSYSHTSSIPSQSQQSQQSQQSSSQAQAQRQAELHERWSRWIDEIGSQHPPAVQYAALDELMTIVGTPNRSGGQLILYLLTKLKLVDRLLPLVSAHATPGQGDQTILERCLWLVASCAYDQWTDRTRRAIFTVPQLIEKCAIVLTKGDHPPTQAQAARALWNIAYRNEEVKHSPAATMLLPKLLDNMSSKHSRLRLYSLGLMWALAENNRAFCEQVGKHGGMLLIVQGLVSDQQPTEAMETYYLLASLANALITYDTTQLCKKQALQNRICVGLHPLLVRSTSTTLMERLCELIVSTMYQQSAEQNSFHRVGGIHTLVTAIQNPIMRRCIPKLALALIAAVYRHPGWIGMGVSPNMPPDQLQSLTASVNQMEESIMPAYAHLAELVRAGEEVNACSMEVLAIALCLGCLAQGKARFQKYLVQKGILHHLCLLMTPPPSYSEGDSIKVSSMGLGILHQVASGAPEVQRWLLTQSPSAPRFPKSALPLYRVTQSDPTLPYGAYFKQMIELTKRDKVRIPAIRTIMVLGGSMSASAGNGDGGASAGAGKKDVLQLLFDDHEDFRTMVLNAIKQCTRSLQQPPPPPAAPTTTTASGTPSAPVKSTPTMDPTDTKNLIYLVGCLPVLCGDASKESSASHQEEVARNFERLTQLVVQDRLLTQALMVAQSSIKRHHQNQQAQQAAMVQAQQQKTVNASMQAMKTIGTAQPMPSLNAPGLPPATQHHTQQQSTQAQSAQQQQHSSSQSQVRSSYNTSSTAGGGVSQQQIMSSQQGGGGVSLQQTSMQQQQPQQPSSGSMQMQSTGSMQQGPQGSLQGSSGAGGQHRSHPQPSSSVQSGGYHVPSNAQQSSQQGTHAPYPSPPPAGVHPPAHQSLQHSPPASHVAAYLQHENPLLAAYMAKR